jgi:ankyrin repeat protein
VLFGRTLDITRVLLAHGANTEQRDEYRWNPHTERADDTGMPYARCEIDLRRATPLIAATVGGDIALVREFLAFGADLMARDADGKTALDYARARSDREMISALQGGPRAPANRPLQPTSGAIRPC